MSVLFHLRATPKTSKDGTELLLDIISLSFIIQNIIRILFTFLVSVFNAKMALEFPFVEWLDT